MTISAVNRATMQSQLNSQSGIKLTPSTNNWMNAIAESLKLNHIESVSKIFDKLYFSRVSWIF